MSTAPVLSEPDTLEPTPGSTKSATTINCKDVSIFYGDFEAIKKVSIDIPDKEVTAFIGPSGCGKSTFLRALNRMNDTIDACHVTGEIRIGGENILGDKVDVPVLRRRVGMVFQKANPFPKSIYENVAYGMRIAGVKDKDLIDETVEKSLRGAAIWDEVKDRLKTSALGLSGGQQQRLCIARSLAVEPDILLMDEPTSALDPIATTKVEELIQHELRDRLTVVIVTHNMQQAIRVADNTAFFYLGDLIEFGKTDQIFNEPREERTRAYVQGDFG